MNVCALHLATLTPTLLLTFFWHFFDANTYKFTCNLHGKIIIIVTAPSFSMQQQHKRGDGCHDWIHTRQCFAVLVSVSLALVVHATASAAFGRYLENDDGRVVNRRLDVATRVDQELTLFPLRPWDYLGFFCATAGLILAAGGGIGGGGILVPVYILLLRFPVKHAVSLSNVTVFGGGIANTILNSTKRHPFCDRPLIDWDLMLVMEPLTMAGALIGANLNEMLPDVVIVVLLVVLLTFTAHKTLKKAIDMHEKETHAFAASATAEDSVGHDPDDEDPLTPTMYIDPLHHAHNAFPNKSGTEKKSTQLLNRCISLPRTQNDISNGYGAIQSNDNNNGSGKKSEDAVHVVLDQTDESEATSNETPEPNLALATILERERHTNVHNFLILMGLFITVIIMNVMIGGGAFKSPLGLECGSFGYWAAQVIMLAFILSVVVYARHHLINETKEKQYANYEYSEGDIVWDSRSTIVYPALCTTAGLAAGLFGIGGGIVKGPLMLAMGVHPSVVSATSACMILFTSFTATTSFMVFGELNYQYASLCLMLGFLATILGQTLMSILLKKYNRNSLIAFTIGSVVALSAVCMTVESVIAIMQGDSKQGAGMCSSGNERAGTTVMSAQGLDA